MTDQALLAEARGEVFLDARGNGRAMRLRWHPEADVIVLSLWRDGICAGTFRMPHEDVGVFVDALVDSLRGAPGVHLPPRGPNAVGLTLEDALGETQAMPVQPAEPGFTDWAFGPQTPDRATAS